LPADRRGPMAQLRATIRAAAPDATEGITYHMPGLKRNRRLLGSSHPCKRPSSLFPSSAPMIEALGDRLTPFLAGKGTIRFPADKPLPLDLVPEIVKMPPAANAPRRGAPA